MKTTNTELHLVDLLYDDELSPEAFEQRLAALEQDPESLAQLKAWGAVQQAMLSLPEPDPDPQVHYDILRAARAAATPVRRGFWEMLAAWSLSPVAAGLGLLVLAGSMLTLYSKQDESPTQFDRAPAALRETAVAEEAKPGAAPAPDAPSAVDRKSAAPQSLAAPIVASPIVASPIVAPPSVAVTEPAAKVVEARRPSADPAVEIDGLLGGLMAKGEVTAEQKPARKAKKRRARRSKQSASKSKGGRAYSAKTPRSKAPRTAKKTNVAVTDDLLAFDDDRAAEPAPAGTRTGDYAQPPPPSPQGGTAAPVEAEPAPEEKVDLAVAQDREEQPARVQAGGDVAEDEAEGLAFTSSARAPAQAPPQAAAPVVAAVDSPAASAPRARRRPNKPAAQRGASSDTQADLAASAGDAQSTLAQARAARSAGRLRDAARAYDDFGRRFRQHGSFAQAMFEAAQTYEGLGDITRAVQLYRLVVSARGANAGAAQVRINQLSPPAQKAGQAPPVTRE